MMERKPPPPTRFPISSGARQPMGKASLTPASNVVPSKAQHGPPRPAFVGEPGVPPSPVQRQAAFPRIIQRYVWGVIDTDDKNNQIVTGNISRFTAAKTGRHTLPNSTDTNISKAPRTRVAMNNGPLHIHGHGREDGFALMSPKTFATRTREKFGAKELKRRTIVFHSCEVGQENFLVDFLRELIESDTPASWNDTRVFGPKRFLGVNRDGISLVSLAGTTESDMSGGNDYFHGLMERKGRGWRVAYVLGGAIAQKDVTVGSEEYVILKNALSLV